MDSCLVQNELHFKKKKPSDLSDTHCGGNRQSGGQVRNWRSPDSAQEGDSFMDENTILNPLQISSRIKTHTHTHATGQRKAAPGRRSYLV